MHRRLRETIMNRIVGGIDPRQRPAARIDTNDADRPAALARRPTQSLPGARTGRRVNSSFPSTTGTSVLTFPSLLPSTRQQLAVAPDFLLHSNISNSPCTE